MFWRKLLFLPLLVTALLIGSSALFAGIPLKGSNGRVITFEGVKSATSQGLILRMDGKEILVGWESFDLEAMKTESPKVHKAYLQAMRGNGPIDLKLGIYENLMTESAFIDGLKADLSKKAKYPLPRLSDFFEHKDDDKRFLSTSYNEDKNAAKRSKRFVDSYESLIEDFFLIKNPSLSTDTVTWYYSGNDPFVIVTEATVSGKKDVSLSHLQVLEFFSNENNSSRAKAAQYLHSHHNAVGDLISVLKKYKQAADTQLPESARNKSAYMHTVDAVLEHFQGFKNSSSMNLELVDDAEDLLRIISK